MDQAAPITWTIAELTNIVSAGAGAAATALATKIAPIASICFGIYIILICLSYMRGAETEPVLDFGLRCVGFAIVIGLGLNAENYTSTVIPLVTGLGGDLASAVSGGTVSAGTMDQLALHYFKIFDEGYEAANSQIFPFNIGPLVLYNFKVALVLLGLIPFLVVAAIAVLIADVGSILVAMVGPIYFACLLFPATRQYFSAWLNTVFSFALIPLFVAVIATISVGISITMFSSEGANFNDSSLKVVFFASLGNLMLLVLMKLVSSLASSLSAGGINAAMPGSIGTLANSIRDSARGSARDVKSLRSAYRATKSAGRWAANKFNSIRKAG